MRHIMHSTYYRFQRLDVCLIEEIFLRVDMTQKGDVTAVFLNIREKIAYCFKKANILSYCLLNQKLILLNNKIVNLKLL